MSTGDAHVAGYAVRFDLLSIELVLWDESRRVVEAWGVSELHDSGTWECDGIVRYHALDDGTRLGYAIVDTDDQRTLCFNASSLKL